MLKFQQWKCVFLHNFIHTLNIDDLSFSLKAIKSQIKRLICARTCISSRSICAAGEAEARNCFASLANMEIINRLYERRYSTMS